MIKLRQAIIVEGRYDKNMLRQLVGAQHQRTRGLDALQNLR